MTAVRPSAGSSNTHRVSLCCQDEANQREELDCWTSSVIGVISHRLHLPLVVFFKLVSMLMTLCTPLCLIGSCTLHPSTITDCTDGYEEIRSEQSQCWKHPPTANSTRTDVGGTACTAAGLWLWTELQHTSITGGRLTPSGYFPVTRFKDQSWKSQSCTCSLHIICRTPWKETFKPWVKLCNSYVHLYAISYFI